MTREQLAQERDEARRDVARLRAHLVHAQHLARTILTDLDGLAGGVTHQSISDLRDWSALVSKDLP